jgi:hypothetical protein
MNKDELLKAIHTGRAEIEALWTTATDEQLDQRPGPQPDWSMKDLAAHLTFWEQEMVRSVSAGQITPEWHENTDVVNARVFEANKNRTVADVLNEYWRSLGQVDALVESLSDADLSSTTRLQTPDNMTLSAYIADETFEHYDDHLEDVRQWAQREGLVR